MLIAWMINFFKILLSVTLLSIAINTSAQINVSFIKHLSTQELKNDHFQYLKQLEGITSVDSLAYYKTKYCLQYNEDSLLFDELKLCKELVFSDTSLLNLITLQFLDPFAYNRAHWFNNLQDKNYSIISNQLLNIYHIAETIDTAGVDLPKELQIAYSSYYKGFEKKPIVAAGLSMLVPGLGKLYGGMSKSAAISFFSNAVYGIQTFEAIQVLGISHPYAIVSSSMFGLFYFSNIYGSYNRVKQAKTHLKEDFLFNAINYYYIHTTAEYLY